MERDLPTMRSFDRSLYLAMHAPVPAERSCGASAVRGAFSRAREMLAEFAGLRDAVDLRRSERDDALRHRAASARQHGETAAQLVVEAEARSMLSRVSEDQSIEIKRQRGEVDLLLGALSALAYPDGLLRGPIWDGPELKELNDAISEVRASRT